MTAYREHVGSTALIIIAAGHWTIDSKSLKYCWPVATSIKLSRHLRQCGRPISFYFYNRSIVTSLTHAPETGAVLLNSTPDSGASFSCRCTTSNIIDCLWDPKAVNDVRSRALARKTGAGIMASNLWRRFLKPVSGACVRDLIVQWHDPIFFKNLVWSINNHFFAFFNSS